MLTPNYVREHVKVPSGTTDEQLQDVIDRALDRLRVYCRWHVFPELQDTVTLSTDGSASALLPSLRVIEVTRVEVSGSVVENFGIDRDGRLRLTSGRFPDALGAVKVTMLHGYSEDELDAVRDVLLGMVERVISLPHFIKSSASGDRSVTYGVDAALRPTFGDKEVLDEYRIARR